MVKLRTQKLEVEIKVKALALELAEVENTHQVHPNSKIIKKISNKKWFCQIYNI